MMFFTNKPSPRLIIKKMAPRLDPSKQLGVVVVSSTGSLAWLEAWRPYLARYEFTIVSEGAAPVAPQGFTVQITTVQQASAALGGSSAQLGALDLAILLAKKKYVFVLDESCSPAQVPASKVPVDAAAQHLTNLTTPSTPFFFNTLYDPFREGTDFVRGYPFSLREGAPTVVSHGLWLNYPDVDAATSMAKPNTRVTQYVDAVLTVPKGAAFPISSRNLAFDRQLIGVALFGGLDGDDKPLGKSGDPTWRSFCVKAITDHLGYGCKTGLPYVSCDKAAVTAATADMEKEYKNVKFQKEVVAFFQSLKLSVENNTVEAAYKELAQQVRTQLGAVDAHFKRVADAMDSWAAAFKQHAA